MNRYLHGVASMLFFLAAVALGFTAIFLASPAFAAGYLFLSAVLAVVALAGFCTKCPHRGLSCVHVAPGVLAALLLPRDEGPYTMREYAGVAITILFMLLFPQYWLVARLPLFLLFWACVVAAGVEIRSSVCRGCENIYCPVRRR